MFKNKAKIAVTVGLLIVLSLVIPSMDSKAQTEDENTITLTFGGDVTFGYKNESGHKGSMPHFLEENGMDYSIIFRNVYDIFSNDDLTVVNLETTITDTTSHMDKTYYFRAPYEYVEILKQGSVEAVSIANNHANDYFARRAHKYRAYFGSKRYIGGRRKLRCKRGDQRHKDSYLRICDFPDGL